MTAIEQATDLMKQGLALLDDANLGEGDATHVKAIACSLQHAIDVAERVPAFQAGDEVHPDLLDAFDKRCSRRG